MADVLNTTSLEIRSSVNVDSGAPPYGVPPWILITREQRDIWSIIPLRYRKWTGVAIEEMTGPEKAAVDAAALEAARDEIIQELDQLESTLRAFAQVVADGFNAHANRTNAILSAIDGAGSLAALKTAVSGINDLPHYTMAGLRSAIRAKLGV